MVHHVLGVPKLGAWALCLALFLLAGKDGRKGLVTRVGSMPLGVCTTELEICVSGHIRLTCEVVGNLGSWKAPGVPNDWLKCEFQSHRASMYSLQQVMHQGVLMPLLPGEVGEGGCSGDPRGGCCCVQGCSPLEEHPLPAGLRGGMGPDAQERKGMQIWETCSLRTLWESGSH